MLCNCVDYLVWISPLSVCHHHGTVALLHASLEVAPKLGIAYINRLLRVTDEQPRLEAAQQDLD